MDVACFFFAMENCDSSWVVKEEYLIIIMREFSPVLHKNINCVYSQETPWRGTSNIKHVLWRNKNYPRIITNTPLQSEYQ